MHLFQLSDAYFGRHVEGSAYKVIRGEALNGNKSCWIRELKPNRICPVLQVGRRFDEIPTARLAGKIELEKIGIVGRQHGQSWHRISVHDGQCCRAALADARDIAGDDGIGAGLVSRHTVDHKRREGLPWNWNSVKIPLVRGPRFRIATR